MTRLFICALILVMSSVATLGADDRWEAVRGLEGARKGAFDLRRNLEAFRSSAPAEVESCNRLIDEFLVRTARLEVGVLRTKIGVPDPMLEKELKECLGMANDIKARGLSVVRAISTSTPNASTASGDEIDRWVDAQVEKNWRPMPGGNSKEDAARVSKAILRAKSFEDLERTIQEESSAGR